jgi:uridine phosphorylase
MEIDKTNIILNNDGSIYHLGLFPNEINDIIFTVGDPDRVKFVSRHFNSINLKKQKREFLIHNGSYKGVPVSVLSTGIGTGNIDIVINELDIISNIDLKTGKLNNKKKQLNIIRLGTSASIQPEINIGSILLSEFAIGFDNLLNFYSYENEFEEPLSIKLMKHLNIDDDNIKPYAFKSDDYLFNNFSKTFSNSGITLTNSGFYGPQSRNIRIPLRFENLNNKLNSFEYSEKKITNLDMETSGIYGLCKLLGHKSLSINAILANRATGDFVKDPDKTIDYMIEQTFNLVESI